MPCRGWRLSHDQPIMDRSLRCQRMSADQTFWLSRPQVVRAEVGASRPRSVGRQVRRALIRGVEVRIEHVETDIEQRVRVELRTRTNHPVRGVGAAAVARQRSERVEPGQSPFGAAGRQKLPAAKLLLIRNVAVSL